MLKYFVSYVANDRQGCQLYSNGIMETETPITSMCQIMSMEKTIVNERRLQSAVIINFILLGTI